MDTSGPNIEIIVDLGLYSQNVLLKATYKFTGDWYVQLATTSENTATVIFSPKTPGDNSANIRGEFLNELLDQSLREQIGSETLAVRNLIMAHALSKFDLISSPNDSNDTTSGQ